ncbi:MAG: metal ABC transporter substrate-binding protein [Lachnospiraceae bacterium]|nr:metal ABC transporter substrate-binding protein [Lachnospiraceae bacterium]
MSKKIIALFSAMIMALSLSACGMADAAPSGNEKKHIVTTIFPEYDWVMNILGDASKDAEVTMLLDNGVDLHSYQPTADDILKISGCDMFIYVGGESDEWVEDALKEAVNKDMVVVNLLETLGDSVKEEEIVEGMQSGEHEHDHDHEDGDEHHEDGDEHHEDGDEHHDDEGEDHHAHDHEEDAEYDEHVWLSLKNAAYLTDCISKELQRIDPANSETYKKNTEDYIAKLNVLDKKFADTVEAADIKTLVFGDRFPFRYLTDDYGLSYYAAFVGCSAETEASFETIMFLAEKADELSVPAVMTIEGDDHRIAETIVQNTKSGDKKILTMDSMQSVTSKDAAAGKNYLSIMESNLSVLSEALKR